MTTALQEPTPPHAKLEDHQERGRHRSRSQDKESNSDTMGDDINGDAYANGENSSNSEGPVRKRRRSRKGLDKKFECPHAGCGKSYSRAEHLHRHQLNHTPKQIYMCDYPGCKRNFVRLDLCNRHRDRHTAKGSSLNRKDTIPNQTSPIQDTRPPFGRLPGSASPETNRPATAYKLNNGLPGLSTTYSPKMSAKMPYSPISGTPAGAYANGFSAANGGDYVPHDASGSAYGPVSSADRQRPPPPSYRSPTGPPHLPPVQTSDMYVLSPTVGQPGFQPQNSTTTPQSSTFVATQNFPSFDLPPSNFSAPGPAAAAAPSRDGPNSSVAASATTSATATAAATTTAASTAATVPESTSYASQPNNDYDSIPPQSGREMMMLDQMSIPNTMPMFGMDSILQKSPHVGLPEDFMVYLFNSTPQEGSPMPMGYANYGQFQNQYSASYPGNNLLQGGYFPTAPQQVMSVTNLLDRDFPESSVLSEEKSQEIFDMIKNRFHEDGDTPFERRNEFFTDDDRSVEEHMLGRRMMQAYIVSYWVHFSDQVPIIHKPTFSPDRSPNLLLIAMMTIGAACLDKTHGQDVIKAGAELSNFLAWHLRWEIFRHSNFRPPAKLWVFQALLLLELYEKMYSTRELHERAHIHHATTITLMRRGRSLIGKTAMESPPNQRSNGSDKDHSSRHSSTFSAVHTQDQWWNNWITNESTRRTAFAAFIIDSIHATMFGHSTVMVAHEMRLPLPCEDKLWKAPSGVEVGRGEAQLQSDGTKSTSFLEGIKKTLNGHEVKTNAFGRTIIMAGLLSVSWHMNQRDLQVNSLGGSHGLGGRDKWRGTLTRALDSWKADYDKSLQRYEGGNVVDPYAYNNANEEQNDGNVVFESRVVLHHLAHMATHVDVVDLQIYARAKRLLGRAIGPHDVSSTQRRMKDTWAPSARARDATYYAIQFLCSVLLRNEGNSPQTNGFNRQAFEQTTYSARDDVLLNRPWVLYFAALVVWSYGYAMEGPSPDAKQPTSWSEQVQQMRTYLHEFGSIASPDDLKSKKGINRNNALLLVLKDTFSQARWELLHEGATLLNNCIQLNLGQMA